MADSNINSKSISIAWRNLSYEIRQHGITKWRSKKLLLQHLNGSFQTRTLNGLVAPSGAGKTTFLSCIAGQIGTNSALYVAQHLPTASYFIEQHVHETMFASLTVRQALEYAFAFKNGVHFKVTSQRQHHIESVMKQLMLPGELLDRQCELCSGGEVKRIAIAQELMSLKKPSFLFADEPISGLDNSTALEVMNCLKQLTQSNDYELTIVVSVHAPNHHILQMFDKLYVLAIGGFCIYADKPDLIEKHLKSVIGREVGHKQPPIEELIRIACENQTPAVQQLASYFYSAELQNICSFLTRLTRQPLGLPKQRKVFNLTDFYLQISRLSRLTFIAGWRLFVKQILNYVLVMLIFISLFNLDMVQPNGCSSHESLKSNVTCLSQLENSSLLKENVNFLNLATHIFCYIIMASACVMLIPMMKVIRNEHRSGWHSLSTFYLSFTIISLLQLALFAVITSFVIYFASDQYSVDVNGLNWTRVGHFVFCLLFYGTFTQSLGQALGVLFCNSIVTGLISSIILHVLIQMINDFYIITSDVDNWFFVSMTDLIGVKYLIRYVVYIFYGIDRCPHGEFSYALVIHNADNPDVIYNFVRAIGINIVLLRFGTFILLYCQFINPLDFIWTWLQKIKMTQNEMDTFNDDNKFKWNALSANTTFSNNDCQVSTSKEINPPHSQVILAWRNLSLYASSSIYEVNSGSAKGSIKILHNLNGQFHFGTLNSLMGTSGAGKTSLLRVLHGQCKNRLSEGTQFYLNKHRRIESCFIAQEVADHLWPGLTVKQALIYSSQLKNCGINREVNHEAIALNLIEQLDLTNTAANKLENCSGGERKRIALAQELTTMEMPNLICIDEPTSGLDSNSAEIVISCLKKLAQKNPITIVTSIHQPNTRIVHMFDQVYVLSRGGLCIYSGPPTAIQSHLGHLPARANLEDELKYSHETLITYSCLEHQSESVQVLSHQNDLQYADLSVLSDCHLVADGVQRTSLRFSTHSFRVLSHRHVSYLLGSRTIELLLLAAFMLFYSEALLFFWQSHKQSDQLLLPGCISISEDDTATNQTSDCSAQSTRRSHEFKMMQLSCTFHFFFHLFFNFLFTFETAAHFSSEFPRLVTEHRNGWYSVGSFYLMKSLFETAIVIPLLMAYLYIGDMFIINRPDMYWNIFALMMLSLTAWQGMIHLIVILSSNSLLLQNMLLISVTLVCAFLANFFAALPHLHYVYSHILANFSIARFTFEALVQLQYGFGQCDPRKEIQPMLYWMGIDQEGYFWHCIWMIIFNLIVYRCIAIWLLVYKLNPVNNRRQRVYSIRDYLNRLKPSNAIII